MTVYNVSNAAALKTALAAAKGGDRILLAPGNYGAVAISKINPAANVTIASADASRPAHVDTMTVTSSSNLTFQGLDVGRAIAPGESMSLYMVNVRKSANVTFDDVHFHGSLDGDPSNDGRGLFVDGSRQVTVRNSEFQQLSRGSVMTNSTDLVVTGNDFHDLRSDGTDFAGVQRVLVAENRYKDFFMVGADHPDAIQFWTVGTGQSKDIVIRDNQILQGEGEFVQGIFLRNADSLNPFKNVTIENNLVYIPDGYNGITVMGGENVRIVGNSAISPTGGRKVSVRVEDVVGGVVERNVADHLVAADNNGVTMDTSNVWLTKTAGFAGRIRGLEGGDAATPAGLTVAGVGWQPKGGAHALGDFDAGSLPSTVASLPAPAPTVDAGTAAPVDVAQLVKQISAELAVAKAPAVMPTVAAEPFGSWGHAAPVAEPKVAFAHVPLSAFAVPAFESYGFMANDAHLANHPLPLA